jgi:hypothetical protein
LFDEYNHNMKKYKELTSVANEDDDMITNSVMTKKKSATKSSTTPKKKSATKRSVTLKKKSSTKQIIPKVNSSMDETSMQKRIIELEQELRIQMARNASMNVVPNNIVGHGQNNVETMSAFAENLWGNSPVPMLNDTNECDGPGNKFSTAAFGALAGPQSASTSTFEGQGNANSAMPRFGGGTLGLGSQITPITNMQGTDSPHDTTNNAQYKLFMDKLHASVMDKLHASDSTLNRTNVRQKKRRRIISPTDDGNGDDTWNDPLGLANK